MTILLSFKLLILIFFSIFFSPNTSAKEQTYSVGVETLQYFPQYTYTNGEYGGFGRAILDAFAQKKGYKFNYVARPVARLNAEFLTGDRFDFRYPENSHWTQEMKKDKNIIYSSPVVEFIDGVMVKPNNKGAGINKLKTLGTVRNFTPWPYLKMKGRSKPKIVENDSFLSLLEMTLLDRIDGAYINVYVAQYQLKHVFNKPNTLVFDPKLPYLKGAYHLASIKHADIIAEFNQFMSQETKLVNQLKKKFEVGTIEKSALNRTP